MIPMIRQISTTVLMGGALQICQAKDHDILRGNSW